MTVALSRDMDAAVTPGHTDAALIIAPPRMGRWFGSILIVLIVAWIVYQILTNPGFEWDVVGEYLLDSSVLSGVLMTLQLTVLVMLIGSAVGIVIAVMRMSGDPLLGFVAHSFVWFFRGTPVLIQLVFWYNLATLFPEIALGIPFGGPKFFEISSTIAISSFTAAMLGLGLNEAAYMAEIVRAGLLSVDPGQSEASKALGHRPTQTFFKVVLPQAMKAIIPPTGNQLIGTLKFTSLASTVALYELMHSVEVIYARTFQTVPMLIVAALWYLFLVSILSIFQYFVERHYSRGWRQPVGGH
ncbi:amino acid ABC transporter permease [Rhizobium sp. CF142]|uniref:amino acid ABC transporter permease n=1 Tax=Rhizobium sp. CF142 TaxID=1144314 RepID=UPI00026EE942|nr:amino acid ABC transporter permease [Rhizobium sp. CF142]EJJ31472.1 amine acid ABC transporter, permease protein, 3-TM region, His/Glu/Gln/Arg/opine family [Rhizobium sp. CF142]